MSDEEGPRCIVSDPAQPHNVSRRAGFIKHDCFACGKTDVPWRVRHNEVFHYYCTICDITFHARCHELPSKMIHPFHPQHPLSFTVLNHETEVIANTNYSEFYSYLSCSNLEYWKYVETPVCRSSIIFDTCTWCGKFLKGWFYRCSICNFTLDFDCARNIPPLTVKDPKNHPHSLTLFPRPLSFPCYACGLINMLEPSYACYQCSYFVHQSCIDLPRVIKITRHPHRLSHTPFLPTKASICRVCYKNVDIKYGQYSCNHEDCTFVVHSKCATHKKVWDEGELEWAPEEPDEAEDIAPFKRVGADLIEHFCHRDHYLRLERYDGVRDSEKQCQACTRPISSHDSYTCTECDFSLHEVCANLPRKLDHALHKHPLSIDLKSLDKHYFYYYGDCSVCLRKSSGFKYRCRKDECSQFQLDINCILVAEYFTHKSHVEHPLFISTTYNFNEKVLCQGCKREVDGYHLHCSRFCDFSICYKCATIPHEIYHKHDDDPLSLCYGESGVADMYWCEVCEKKLDPTTWFYTNSKRCTTIHCYCLFGDSAYMKSGHTFRYCYNKVEIVDNGTSSRPKCHTCGRPCSQLVYFTMQIFGAKGYKCSFYCLEW